MEWTAECDDEYEELMEDYAQLEPAIERAARFEDRLLTLETLVKKILEDGKGGI